MQYIKLAVVFLPIALSCSVKFYFNNQDLQQTFAAKVRGPYLRLSSEMVIKPGETAVYFAEGDFFSCHGEYKVSIKERSVSNGTKNEFVDKRYFFFDSTAVIGVSEANDGSLIVNYDVTED